ncbi:hypothetical protein M408DRAFT_333373 [Serendipita vermifera MAFF 305830]|uniref:Uncharacterized protein n=1 Tax=Serendipita vermifera MAFF 305830 TaxID=933852 RepID=A0A0C2W561_SERVB|nr:hypothetical protein M408DRAFT_333373 [Serendipita vermifera MAFF 305830]
MIHSHEIGCIKGGIGGVRGIMMTTGSIGLYKLFSTPHIHLRPPTVPSDAIDHPKPEMSLQTRCSSITHVLALLISPRVDSPFFSLITQSIS